MRCERQPLIGPRYDDGGADLECLFDLVYGEQLIDVQAQVYDLKVNIS